MTPIHVWAVFIGVITLALLADLSFFHRKAHEVKLKEALLGSAGWIGLALLFNVFVFFYRGRQAGLEFMTGYLVEQSLSVDNVFAFLVILQAFRVPRRSEHKVLFYGVLGALVMRAVFVAAGVALLQAVKAVMLLFGAILIFAGVRMLIPRKRAMRPERNLLVRLARRFFPVSENPETEEFFLKRTGTTYATPLFLALVAVEAMDIVFSVDSVPAVLAITRDTFIVYSSNAFAILGLRSLYFALAGLLPKFRFLHYGLGAILVLVGTKMLLSERVPISTSFSLIAIAFIMSATILASVIFARRKRAGGG